MTPYSEAKELYNEHKYEEALEKIETAIEKSNNHNIFHYHLYCQILRKLGKAQDFLDLINELIDDEKFGLSEFVNDISWCIYDLYVRDYSENSDYDIVEKAKFILDNCIQPEEENQFSNPLIFTILKIVKVLKRKNYVNYRLIIEILEKLDYNKLSSTDTFQFIDNNDKERELASKREQYYQDLSRAYEKTRKYDECSKLCAIALNDNIKWHYKNDLWLKARKSYCDCMQSNTNDDTISLFVEIAEKNRFWYMYQKLSSVFFSRGNIDESLKYACKAFEIDNDIEKK